MGYCSFVSGRDWDDNVDGIEAYLFISGRDCAIVRLSQAVIGLIMSAVMKHASNITRLFLISCAMLVATTLSVLIFHLQLNVYFCVAFVLVIVAVFLYYRT